MKLKFKSKKKDFLKKSNNKYKINSQFNHNLLNFNSVTNIINSKSNSFLDDYYAKNYLVNKNDINNSLKPTLWLNKNILKKININKSLNNNNEFQNLFFLNQQFISRESFELGYNNTTNINFNQKYIQYFYTKLFRLKLNKVITINNSINNNI